MINDLSHCLRQFRKFSDNEVSEQQFTKRIRACEICLQRVGSRCNQYEKHCADFSKLKANWCEHWNEPAVPKPVRLVEPEPVKPAKPTNQVKATEPAEDITCDVVIPYCQANLRWLPAAVDSILNQAGSKCVVHLITDGFEVEDDPADYYKDHPQVRLYRNEKSIGPYRTLNRIFDRLETDYIAVQDSDDIALPHRIEHSIKTLQSKDGEIYGGAMRQFVSHEATDEESLKRLKATPIHRSGHKKWKLCPEGNVINGTLVVRKDTYQRLNGFADLMGSADLEFATRARRAGCKIITDDEIVCLRRLHSKSLSHGPTHGDKTASRKAAHEKIKKSYDSMVPGCNFRKFGSLGSIRYWSHLTRPVDDKIAMENLEIHVSHACNLACEQCSHYSNYNHKGMLTPEEADRQMGFWSGRLLPRWFSLLGGEPTLNPALVEICQIAKRHWPHSILQLVTNGFLLHRHPELPAILESEGIRLEISIHHDSQEYQDRLKTVHELIAEWKSAYEIKVNFRTSNERWRRSYQSQGQSMLPYSDNQPEASWDACPSKWCPQIYQDKIWKCPQVTYLSMQDEKFELDESWNPYLKYTPLSPDCTDKELAEFVNRKAESCCGMCPASPELFQLPFPLKRRSQATN